VIQLQGLLWIRFSASVDCRNVYSAQKKELLYCPIERFDDDERIHSLISAESIPYFLPLSKTDLAKALITYQHSLRSN
jgi:hypothetical protein